MLMSTLRAGWFCFFSAKKHLNARGLRMNISAPVRSSDSANVSKNAYSLVDCTRKKIFFLGGAG